MAFVRSHPHEAKAYLNFTEHGLRPYWALAKLFDSLEDHSGVQLTLDAAPFDGEEWSVSFGYHECGIAARPEDDVEGALYEWDLTATPDAPDDRRKASFNVSPRFDGMTDTSGDEISSPFQHDTATIAGETVDMPDEAVCVEANTSNLEPDHAPTLLAAVVRALSDLADTYFDYYLFDSEIHETSNLVAYERYVRYLRSEMPKIVGMDGVLHRIMHLVADQKGAKMTYEVDNEKIVGYNHQARLWRGPAVRSLLKGHTYGRQLKNYMPKQTDRDPDDPLYHPKLCAKLVKKYNKESVYWHERHEVERELEETIVNALAWAGIPVKSGGVTYVSDDHFDANASARRDVERKECPLPELEAQQDAMLVKTLRELTDSDRDVLDELVTDGGDSTTHDLADDTDYSLSTVYRALQRLDGLLEYDNARVSFISEKIAQSVREQVQMVEQAVESQAQAINQLLGMDPRHLDQQGSAFERWLVEYGVDVLGEGDDLTLDVGAVLTRFKSISDYPHLAEVLEELRSAWTAADRFGVGLDEVSLQWNEQSGTSEAMPASRALSKFIG